MGSSPGQVSTVLGNAVSGQVSGTYVFKIANMYSHAYNRGGETDF